MSPFAPRKGGHCCARRVLSRSERRHWPAVAARGASFRGAKGDIERTPYISASCGDVQREETKAKDVMPNDMRPEDRTRLTSAGYERPSSESTRAEGTAP